MTSLNKKKTAARFALVLCAMIWGGSFVVVKVNVAEMGAGFILAVRFTIAAVLLAVFFRSRLGRIDRQCLRDGTLVGMAMYLGFVFQTVGLIFTQVGKSTFISASYCVLTPFTYWIAVRKHPGASSFTAAFLCLAGIGVISLQHTLTVSKGDGLTLICGVFYALEITLLGTLCRRDDMMMVTLVEMTVSAIISWIYVFVSGSMPHSITAGEILSLLYLGIPATFIGMTMQNWAQKYVESYESALLLALESVFGTVMSVVFLGDRLSLRLIAGFTIVSASIVVSVTGGIRQMHETPPAEEFAGVSKHLAQKSGQIKL